MFAKVTGAAFATWPFTFGCTLPWSTLATALWSKGMRDVNLRLTTCVFWVFEIIVFVFNHSILLVGRKLVLNSRWGVLRELFLSKWFLNYHFHSFLDIPFQVADLIIHWSVNLVTLRLRLIYIPVSNLAVISSRDHVICRLIVKHKALVVIPRQKDGATRVAAGVSLIDSLEALCWQVHIVLVCVSDSLLTH